MHKRILFFLLLISILIGIILRIFYLKNHANIMADIGRDLLMGRQISFFGKIPKIGHCSSYPGLYYSPYYFYFLAILTKIWDNVFFLFFISSMLNILSIYFLFKSVQILFNLEIAIFSTIYYILFPKTIELVNIWSAFIAQSFFIFAFYFFSLFIKSKNMKYLFISIITFIFIAVSDLSHAYFLPLFFIVSIYYGFRYSKNIIKIIIFWLIVFIIAVFPIVSFYRISNLLSIIADGINPKNQSFYILLQNNIKTLMNSFYTINTSIVISSIFLLILIIFRLIKFFNSRENINLNELFLIFIFQVGLFISALKSDIHSYQLMALWPLYFIIISFLFFDIFKFNKRLLLIIFLFHLFLILDFSYFNQLIFTKNNTLLRTKEIAEKIQINLDKYKINQNDFIIYANTFDGRLLGIHYYYFLKKINTPYLNIKDGYSFSFEEETDKKYVFIICEYETGCLKNIDNDYLINKEIFYNKNLIKGYKLVFNK